jgi:hypothetical protein
MLAIMLAPEAAVLEAAVVVAALVHSRKDKETVKEKDIMMQ